MRLATPLEVTGAGLAQSRGRLKPDEPPGVFCSPRRGHCAPGRAKCCEAAPHRRAVSGHAPFRWQWGVRGTHTGGADPAGKEVRDPHAMSRRRRWFCRDPAETTTQPFPHSSWECRAGPAPEGEDNREGDGTGAADRRDGRAREYGHPHPFGDLPESAPHPGYGPDADVGHSPSRAMGQGHVGMVGAPSG